MKNTTCLSVVVSTLFLSCGIALIPSPGEPAGETPETVDVGDVSVSGGIQHDRFYDHGFKIMHMLITAKTGLTATSDAGVRFFMLRNGMPDNYDFEWDDANVAGFGFCYKRSQNSARRFFAWQTGCAVGFLEQWNYLHLSFSTILGYENRFVIPYGNFKVHANSPLWVDRHLKKDIPQPRMTVAFTEYIGVKLPLANVSPYLPSLYGEAGLRHMTFTQHLLINFYALLMGSDEFLFLNSFNFAAGLEWSIPGVLPKKK